MQQLLTAFVRTIDRLTDRIGRFLSWITVLLVVLVTVDVLLRYAFAASPVWLRELQWQLFALLFLGAGAYTLRHDKHVRVDLFYGRFAPADRARVNGWGSLLFLLPWTAVLVWYGYDAALSAWRVGEGSPNPGGLPAWYVVKSAVPLGMALLFLQGLAEVIRGFFLPPAAAEHQT